jgi:hypothetical protein
MLEEGGPEPNQTAALDSQNLSRDPFTVTRATNLFDLGGDLNTRILIFVTKLELAQDESAASVIINLTDANNQSYDIAVEDVRLVPGFNFAQVVFRLPDNLATGTCTIKVRAHGQITNSGTIRIRNLGP